MLRTIFTSVAADAGGSEPRCHNESVIDRKEVMPMLLAACPSFLDQWAELRDDPCHLNDDGSRLLYLDAGYFARHLVETYKAGHLDELAATFTVIERLLIEGDDYVEELAAIGFLEDIENFAGHGGVDPKVFEPFLLRASWRWWRGLERFWSGSQPVAEPFDGWLHWRVTRQLRRLFRRRRLGLGRSSRP
ncbi:MAG: hypothetical protein GY720_06730 [bacterium]|nr:hypothetical protein [bacterium]